MWNPLFLICLAHWLAPISAIISGSLAVSPKGISTLASYIL